MFVIFCSLRDVWSIVPDTIMQAAITAFQLRGKQIAASLNPLNGQFPHMVVLCFTNTRKVQKAAVSSAHLLRAGRES